MLVLNLPFKALMFLTLMRPSLVLFLVLWLKLVKDFLKVRCRLALLPFLISCLIWLDLVASLPLIKERILVIILLLHFLSLMLGSVLVLMFPLLLYLTLYAFCIMMLATCIVLFLKAQNEFIRGLKSGATKGRA